MKRFSTLISFLFSFLSLFAQPDTLLNSSGSVTIGGTLKITGGNPGTGKILKSDAVGRTSWVASDRYNVTDYGAKVDGKNVYDASASGTTVTSSSANFQPSDVGKKIKITNGVSSGVDLIATITARASTTSITISASSASVSSAYVEWGTDDTPALQALINTIAGIGNAAIIRIPNTGIMILADTLHDVALSNSQIVLPAVSLLNRMLVITLEGVVEPQLQYFTWNSYSTTNGFSAISSFLTGGTGTAAVFSGPYSSAVDPNQNNVQLNLKNIVCIAPQNPTFTFFNLKYQQANRVEGVHIFARTNNLNFIAQPTHSNSYGITFPDENHTPNTIIDNFRVMGFYTGMSMSESIFAKGVRISGCYRGIDCQFGYHISVFTDLAIYWTPYGIVSNASRNDNINRLRVIGYGIEHHGTSGGAAWMDNIADIYDPNNYLLGDLVYVSVQPGIGNVPNSNPLAFVKNGGTNFTCTPLGSVTYGAAPTITFPTYVTGTAGLVNDSTVDITFSQDIKAYNYTGGVYITKNGTPQTISSATRQTNKAHVYYVIPSMTTGDTVRYSYTSANGTIGNLNGYQLQDVSTKTIPYNNTPSLTTILEDNFTGSDGTALSSHTIAPTNNPSATWTIQAGSNFEIFSNRARPVHTGGATVQVAYVDAGISDGTITLIGSKGSSATDMGLIFRYVDANNYWFVIEENSGASFTLYERASGTNTALATISKAFSPSTDYTYKVVLSGTSITCTVDGGSTLNYSSSSKQTATKYGMWSASSTTGCTYDNIKIQQ